jgi:hypothetical protein
MNSGKKLAGGASPKCSSAPVTVPSAIVRSQSLCLRKPVLSSETAITVPRLPTNPATSPVIAKL